MFIILRWFCWYLKANKKSRQEFHEMIEDISTFTDEETERAVNELREEAARIRKERKEQRKGGWLFGRKKDKSNSE